ncbi:unnamed protein product, partial [Meganyctiphanes norvegica]
MASRKNSIIEQITGHEPPLGISLLGTALRGIAPGVFGPRKKKAGSTRRSNLYFHESRQRAQDIELRAVMPRGRSSRGMARGLVGPGAMAAEVIMGKAEGFPCVCCDDDTIYLSNEESQCIYDDPDGDSEDDVENEDGTHYKFADDPHDDDDDAEEDDDDEDAECDYDNDDDDEEDNDINNGYDGDDNDEYDDDNSNAPGYEEDEVSVMCMESPLASLLMPLQPLLFAGPPSARDIIAPFQRDYSGLSVDYLLILHEFGILDEAPVSNPPSPTNTRKRTETLRLHKAFGGYFRRTWDGVLYETVPVPRQFATISALMSTCNLAAMNTGTPAHATPMFNLDEDIDE